MCKLLHSSYAYWLRLQSLRPHKSHWHASRGGGPPLLRPSASVATHATALAFSVRFARMLFQMAPRIETVLNPAAA